jgi:hypothetical protein
MPDPREAISAFREQHPRATGVLYQVVLCVVTFECVVAIARYDPGPVIKVPAGSTGWVSTVTSTNSTTERMCKFGAREDDVDVGPFAVCLPADSFYINDTYRKSRSLSPTSFSALQPQLSSERASSSLLASLN